ncbi:MAG TPA: type II secretion system F family protein [Vicinamibacterales bacterium]|nr:type II secretion system F family protein [Vicinamibacterales bacterium]
MLSRTAPERRRLRDMGKDGAGSLILSTPRVTDSLSPLAERMAVLVPKSPRELSNLRRHLTTAGLRDLSAAIYFSTAKIVLPIALGLLAFMVFGFVRGWLAVLAAAIAGFVLPELWLSREIKLRQKAIRNGLPDALDLLIVCLEAGSSLDQSILKAGVELEVAYPALADELKLITTEIRAGKPRLDALKNFAERTKVADVRALVSMLVQTDRFGTSVAQALRTHAETSRTKRRQRAEERAAKIGVKLVFPLVFLLFPALYIVILGPAVIRFVRVFMEQAMQGTLQ